MLSGKKKGLILLYQFYGYHWYHRPWKVVTKTEWEMENFHNRKYRKGWVKLKSPEEQQQMNGWRWTFNLSRVELLCFVLLAWISWGFCTDFKFLLVSSMCDNFFFNKCIFIILFTRSLLSLLLDFYDARNVWHLLPHGKILGTSWCLMHLALITITGPLKSRAEIQTTPAQAALSRDLWCW